MKRRKNDDEMPFLLVLCLQIAQLSQDKEGCKVIKQEADDYMKTFGKNTKMTMTKQYLECLLEDVTNGLDYIDSLGNGKGEA